jgi:hypothetical protein
VAGRMRAALDASIGVLDLVVAAKEQQTWDQLMPANYRRLEVQ